jgi:leader peptidase (prepilin peptidase)/N-methyltransferase
VLFLIVCSAVFGVIVGSFLNVVIWRVPRDESIRYPASHCPSCGEAVRPRDNVPILGWLILRGRCRDCQEPISRRYPLVEGLTGVLFAVTAWHFGVSWALPAYLYLVSIGVALALIDLDVKRLPDKIVLPSYGVAVVLLAVASIGTHDLGALLRAAIGGVALFLLYFVLNVIHPKGMGFGDVKLAGVLGLFLGWIGWGPLIVGAFLGFLFGGLLGGGLMMIGRATRKSAIPFGPFMLLGAYVAVLAGGWVAGGYLSLLS